MSRAEWSVRMAFGWLCYVAWNPLPHRMQFSRLGMRMLPHVGFYAFDDGYENNRMRATVTVTVKHD